MKGAALSHGELDLLRYLGRGPCIAKALPFHPDTAYKLLEKKFVTATRDQSQRGRPTTYRITDTGRRCMELFEGVGK